MWRVFLYLFSIILANVVTARFAPLQVWSLAIPWGTVLVGLTFILRDLVQTKYGRPKTYLAITVALALSAITSYRLGDTLAIVAASAIAFIVSETIDTEIFTRMKASFARRVFASGLFGGLADSTLFAVIGLSPIGAGFLPWALVPGAIAGQFIVKTLMQALGAGVLYYSHRKLSK